MSDSLEASKRQKDIAQLRDLIRNLPTTLPTQSTLFNADNPTHLRNVYSVFNSFQPDLEWLEETDDLTAAVTRVFKKVFGWNADRDRAVVFTARGKDVEAMVDVLEKYTTDNECLKNIGPLDAWLERMITMAEATHSQAQAVINVSSEILIVFLGDQLTGLHAA
jgi:hypothetical protein